MSIPPNPYGPAKHAFNYGIPSEIYKGDLREDERRLLDQLYRTLLRSDALSRIRELRGLARVRAAWRLLFNTKKHKKPLSLNDNAMLTSLGIFLHSASLNWEVVEDLIITHIDLINEADPEGVDDTGISNNEDEEILHATRLRHEVEAAYRAAYLTLANPYGANKPEV